MSEKVKYVPPKIFDKTGYRPYVSDQFEEYLNQIAPGLDTKKLNENLSLSISQISGSIQAKDITAIMTSIYLSIMALATAGIYDNSEILSKLMNPTTVVCGVPAFYMTWAIWTSEATARAIPAAEKELSENIMAALKSDGVIQ